MAAAVDTDCQSWQVQACLAVHFGDDQVPPGCKSFHSAH